MRKGFTLIELLVVIAVIAIVTGLLLPALAVAKSKGLRAMCTSNMRQWGISLALYGNEHNDYFPPNRDDDVFGYHGTNVQYFWREYLLKWRKTSYQKERNNPLFCPTDVQHRIADLAPDLSESVPVFAGYNLLPYRSVNTPVWDYEIGKVKGWTEREKFNTEFFGAPTLVDRVEGIGTATTESNFNVMSWMTDSYSDNKWRPTASHAGNA